MWPRRLRCQRFGDTWDGGRACSGTYLLCFLLYITYLVLLLVRKTKESQLSPARKIQTAFASPHTVSHFKMTLGLLLTDLCCKWEENYTNKWGKPDFLPLRSHQAWPNLFQTCTKKPVVSILMQHTTVFLKKLKANLFFCLNDIGWTACHLADKYSGTHGFTSLFKWFLQNLAFMWKLQ